MCIMLYLKVIWCNAIFIQLFSIGVGGNMYPQYMWILLYVKLIWCNCIAEIYCQLQWMVNISSVYVHSAIYNNYLV